MGEALGTSDLGQAASLGMVLNLFNLVPLALLDDGQIVQAVSEPLIWTVLHALAVLLFWLPPQALAVVALMVSPLIAAHFWMGDIRSAATAPNVLRPCLRRAYGLGYSGAPSGGGAGDGVAQPLRDGPPDALRRTHALGETECLLKQ